MIEKMQALAELYGLYFLFFGVAFDHSGIPVPILVFVPLIIEGDVSINSVAFVVFIGAFFADLVYYYISNKLSRFLPKSFVASSGFVKAKKLAAEESLMLIVIGRYLPIVGRFIPFAYGAIGYDLKRFMIATLVGSLVLTVGFVYLYVEILLQFDIQPEVIIYFFVGLVILKIVYMMWRLIGGKNRLGL